MSHASNAYRGAIARPSLARWVVVGVVRVSIAATIVVGAVYLVGRSLGFFASLGEEARYFRRGNITALRFAGSDASFVSASVSPSSLSLWATRSGKESALPDGGPSIDVSRDGKWLVAVDYQGPVTLIELPAGRIARQWSLPEGSVLCVAINGDGSELYIGQGPLLNGPIESTIPEALSKYHFWSVDSRSNDIGDPTASLEAPIRAIDASSDGRIVALRTSSSSCWIWSNKAKDFIVKPENRRIEGGTQLEWGMVGGVKVTPDGKYVQCGYDIFDTEDGSNRNLVRSMVIERNGREEWPGTPSCDISDDGRWAAFGHSGGIATVVDVATARKVWEKRVSRSGSAVQAVAFSPDGKYLLTGGMSGRGAFTPIEPKRGITQISDQHIRLWKLPE